PGNRWGPSQTIPAMGEGAMGEGYRAQVSGKKRGQDNEAPNSFARKQALSKLSDDRCRSRREALAMLSAVGAGMVLAPSASVAQSANKVRNGAVAENASGTTVRRPERYEDSRIFERKPFAWRGGKTLAVWITPTVEGWR